MGKRKQARQAELWVAATELPMTSAHPFYSKLNEVLAKHGFDRFAEEACKEFYAPTMGRPGIPPGKTRGTAPAPGGERRLCDRGAG